MKLARWVAVLALGVGAVAMGGACTNAPGRAAEAQSHGLAGSPAATSAATADTGIVYVDVRTDSEFGAGHVVGALHIPYDQMEQRYGELEPYEGRNIVLYCRSGHRAGIAEQVLESEGFSHLTAGALADLRSQGVPTTP